MIGRVQLRPLTEADLDTVHGLEVASSPDPWSRELLAGELDEPPEGRPCDRLWLVAAEEPGSTPIGFGGVLLIADEAHIMNLVVAESFRRAGVASTLLAGLLSAATDRGAVDATLEVRVSNGAAISLYQRFGFVEAGRRRGYYSSGEDATIMWCRKLYRPDHQQRWLALTGDRSADV